MSVKLQVEELRHEVELLKKRVKRDEKEGVLNGKERKPREASEYNIFIRDHINEMSGKTSQERFRQVVELFRKEQGKRGKRKPVEEGKRKRKNEEEEAEEEEYD